METDECDNLINSTNIESSEENIFKKYCKDSSFMPSILPKKRRIIAIGDIHGDLKYAINCLKIAKVIKIINNKIHWIGEDTYVVQVGDQLDGCRPQSYKCNNPLSKTEHNHKNYNKNIPEDIYVMNFFTKIDKKARKHNGAVISLLGNHETMNSMGNLNYVSFYDLEKSKNIPGIFKKGGTLNSQEILNLENTRKNLFKPGNEMAQYMACNRLSAVIIGNFIFVHAGIVSPFMKKINMTSPKDLYKINCYMRKWLLGLIDEKNVDIILNNLKFSMFWHRILGSIPPNVGLNDPQCASHIKNALNILNIKHMIIGHTPQFAANNMGINSTCDNIIWRVDTGSSFSFDKFDDGKYKEYRNIQVLEILDDHIDKPKFNILYST
jgi:hypothetical protein